MAEPAFAAPIRSASAADEADPTRYTVDTGQARLGLPTRDYYLLPGEKYVGIRKAYRDYIIAIQQLAGIPDAAAKADRIIALETQLSQDQWTPERRRDPQATYNPMDRAQLAELAPQFDWPATLDHLGLGAMPTVVVARAERGRRGGQADRRRAARDLEGLSRLPLRQRPCAIPAQGVRRRAFRFLQPDAERRADPVGALEARRAAARCRSRRGGRPALRRSITGPPTPIGR